MRRIDSLSALLGTLTILGSATASAQGETPQAVTDLQCLIGTWTGLGQVEMGSDTHDVRIEYTCRGAAGGAGVACHVTMTGIEGFTYEADDLWGYDPGSGRVHWFTVSNAGETHDHAGVIVNNAFAGTYVGRRENAGMRENVRFRFDRDNRLVASSVVYVAHQRVEALDVTMTREAPRVARASGR